MSEMLEKARKYEDEQGKQIKAVCSMTCILT